MHPDELSALDKIKYVQDTLYVIAGKWKLPIMIAISFGSNRFRDIQRNVPKITTKVLSKELKDLEINKLVIRKVFDGYPVTVEYTVAPYCKTLKPLVDEMVKWGQQHRTEISKK